LAVAFTITSATAEHVNQASASLAARMGGIYKELNVKIKDPCLLEFLALRAILVLP
jgi:hypothetical protein